MQKLDSRTVNWHSLLQDNTNLDDLKNILLPHSIDIMTFETKSFEEGSTKFSYYFDYKVGISIGFKDNSINSVFLYSQYDKKFQKWAHSLPYGFHFDMNNVDIVSFLGEPSQKSGGKTIPICLSYERLGIEITFVGSSWELFDNKINFICLFAKDTSSDKMTCAVCAKQSNLKCSQCLLACYCSKECQANHWKVHKKYCSDFRSTW